MCVVGVINPSTIIHTPLICTHVPKKRWYMGKKSWEISSHDSRRLKRRVKKLRIVLQRRPMRGSRLKPIYLQRRGMGVGRRGIGER